MRASAVAEKAGVRSVSLVASGFLKQAHAIAKALGAENMAVAEYPGVPMTDSKEDLRKKVEEFMTASVIKGLTTPAADSKTPVEPGQREIVFTGTLREVHEFFHQNLWTEGLPIVPPTVEEVERFLAFTDRSPDEVIGVLLPENRQATVWNVAVNGVMAGCRPEYMPILIAVVEAITDPEFRIEDAGSTPGWEPLIILNGPLVKELDFNCGSGVMRVGRQANTTIGRFLRLYMRNVAGLRIPPGDTDKGSIASTFNVVLAENEDAVAELGWEPFSVDRGFRRGENVATVQSVISISPPTYTAGNTALEHAEMLAELIGRRSMTYWAAHCIIERKGFPLFLLSPSIVRVLARDGWTKDDLRRYLYDNVKAPAGFLEKLRRSSGKANFDFCTWVEQGLLPKEYCESSDPERLIRIFLRPDWIGIVVSGDPGRNQSRGYMQNQKQGPPVSKRIALPNNWEKLRNQ